LSKPKWGGHIFVNLSQPAITAIYNIGNKKPVAGTANWLPAPAAGFNLMKRIYGPKEEG
jgi:hypothetical protein